MLVCVKEYFPFGTLYVHRYSLTCNGSTLYHQFMNAFKWPCCKNNHIGRYLLNLLFYLTTMHMIVHETMILPIKYLGRYFNELLSMLCYYLTVVLLSIQFIAKQKRSGKSYLHTRIGHYFYTEVIALLVCFCTNSFLK